MKYVCRMWLSRSGEWGVYYFPKSINGFSIIYMKYMGAVLLLVIFLFFLSQY